MRKRLVLCLCLCLSAVLMVAGCIPGQDSDFVETARIGAMTDSTGALYIEQTYPQANLQKYPAIQDAVTDLLDEKLDYVITAYTTALNYVRAHEELEILPQDLINTDVAIAVAKDNEQLLTDLSAALTQFKDDGTLDTIIGNWIKEDGSPYTQSDIPAVKEGQVLRVGIAANREPMCFMQGDTPSGLDCELIERLAFALKMQVEYVDMPFAELLPALESGQVDVVISNLAITEERQARVNFTEKYFQNPQVLLTKKTP